MARHTDPGSRRPGVFRAIGRGLRWFALDRVAAALSSFTFWTLLAAAAFYLAFYHFDAAP